MSLQMISFLILTVGLVGGAYGILNFALIGGYSKQYHETSAEELAHTKSLSQLLKARTHCCIGLSLFLFSILAMPFLLGAAIH